MSHFTCLVIGDEPEEQLAPFNEQDEKYIEFIEDEEAMRANYDKYHTDEYDTFEDFVKDHGYEKRQRNGEIQYGYRANPDARWDWYVLGGRWTGHFILKDNKVGVLGEHYLATPEAGNRADACLAGQVDWDLMKKREHGMSTFSVLKDGVFCERGSMGWFGCVTDEMDGDDWDAKFAELVLNLDPETPIALYDLHI
jgi:hypothetical protein